MVFSREKSWFNYVKELLDSYGLPLTFERFENPPSKSEWKQHLNNSVNFAVEVENGKVNLNRNHH